MGTGSTGLAWADQPRPFRRDTPTALSLALAADFALLLLGLLLVVLPALLLGVLLLGVLQALHLWFGPVVSYT